MMFGFLSKNDKGFYLVENGKFMFIERHCKEELHEGFCEYEELIDKGKYSFIRAKNIISGTYVDAINSGVVSLRPDVVSYNYNGLTFWRYLDENGFSFYAYIDGEVYEFDHTSSIVKYLSDNRRWWTSVLLDSFYIERASASSIRPSIENLIDLVIPKLQGVYSKVLYSEKMNVFEIQTEYYVNSSYAVVDGVSVKLTSTDCVSEIKDWKDITDKVTSFILDNNLAIHSSYGDNDGIVSKTVSLANGDHISRLFLANSRYSREHLEEVRGILDDSKKAFEGYRNAIGKRMSTKAALDILPKFNCKNYQLGSF